MEHYYKNITGWCDFEEIYKEAVENFDGGLFVEAGTANGQSTAFLCVEIANSKKDIQLITCDIFEAANQEQYVRSHLDKFPFLSINKQQSMDLFRALKKKGERPNFIFLDGDHSLSGVSNELKIAWDILAKGGILAGHDYLNNGSPDVKKAVDIFCKNNKLKLEIKGSSFILRK